MSTTNLYWIHTPGNIRLAISARPRAHDWLADEIAAWRASGIDTIVSVLEHGEVVELGLQNEGDLCSRNGIEFRQFPVPDRGVPNSTNAAAKLVEELLTTLNHGKAVAIHCRAGIGRASVIAGCVLVGCGLEPATALELISKARGLQVPDTDQQRQWLTQFREGWISYSAAALGT